MENIKVSIWQTYGQQTITKDSTKEQMRMIKQSL